MSETKKYLKRVFIIGKKYKRNFLGFTLGSLFSIIINIFYPLFCAKQILYLTENNTEQLIYASIVVLTIGLFNVVNGIIINRNTERYFTGVTKDVQISLAHEILKISNKSIDNTSSGVFIERLTKDTENLSHIFTMGIGLLTGIIENIGILIAVFILDWRFGIYYLMTSLIITMLYVIFAQKAKVKDLIYRKQNEKVTGLTSELVRGIRDIKMLNSKDIYVNNLSDNIENASEKLFKFRSANRVKKTYTWTTVTIFEFVLVLLLIFFIDNNLIAVSTALIVFNYHNSTYENLMEKVNSLITELKNFTLSSERVFSILDNKEFEKEKFGKKHIDNIVGDFEFKNVSFSYDGENNVLNNFNLKIKANKTYGIVGKSGEGKTTVFNLLCKMYDYNTGCISIDDIDINELDEDSIRGNITIISQNPYIFNLSIKDNLKLVKEDVTDAEIVSACKLACLTDFIESLPNKYDTVVGEGGVTLSGGQRQRLAIARALIQKTKIILFDEATSALDNETQNNIQTAINNMKDEYTIVIIAHRLSTIINCDEIYFMKDGKIENKGSHEELLKNSKSYRQLYEYEIKTDTSDL